MVFDAVFLRIYNKAEQVILPCSFSCSIVFTDANEAKITYLGVPIDLIEAHGVVSEEVAAAMASGVAKTAGCEVGVATSGIAGPSGAVPGKPVGTVCFGFYINGSVHTDTCHFDGMERNEVRAAAVNYVFETLAKGSGTFAL